MQRSADGDDGSILHLHTQAPTIKSVGRGTQVTPLLFSRHNESSSLAREGYTLGQQEPVYTAFPEYRSPQWEPSELI
jgi:hypothetical protein